MKLQTNLILRQIETVSHSTAIIHRVTSFLCSKRFFKPTWNSKFFLSLKWRNSSYFQLLLNFLPFSGTLTARDIYLAWTQKYIPFELSLEPFFLLINLLLRWINYGSGFMIEELSNDVSNQQWYEMLLLLTLYGRQRLSQSKTCEKTSDQW